VQVYEVSRKGEMVDSDTCHIMRRIFVLQI
jgi:hypothetical protein